jgi:hypothetical protein
MAVEPNWMFGYQAEMQDAMQCFTEGRKPRVDAETAADVILTVYSAYLSAERQGAEIKIPQI